MSETTTKIPGWVLGVICALLAGVGVLGYAAFSKDGAPAASVTTKGPGVAEVYFDGEIGDQKVQVGAVATPFGAALVAVSKNGVAIAWPQPPAPPPPAPEKTPAKPPEGAPVVDLVGPGMGG